MKFVFLVHHVREIPDSEDDVKFIGVYTSKAFADAAVDSHKQLPGFVDLPYGFTVEKVELNKDDWNEGFVTIISEENLECEGNQRGT